MVNKIGAIKMVREHIQRLQGVVESQIESGISPAFRTNVAGLKETKDLVEGLEPFYGDLRFQIREVETRERSKIEALNRQIVELQDRINHLKDQADVIDDNLVALQRIAGLLT